VGERLRQRTDNQIAYIKTWQDQLRAVRQNYLAQERNTVASAVISKPCTALTPADLAAMGLAGARPHDNSSHTGQGCAYLVGETGVDIDWLASGTEGLADLYALKSEMAYWIPMTISGYPAVEAVVQVGVSDQKYVTASGDVAGRNADQACSLAKRAAAAVIKNLQGDR
jgi:hypothetical protein